MVLESLSETRRSESDGTGESESMSIICRSLRNSTTIIPSECGISIILHTIAEGYPGRE